MTLIRLLAGSCLLLLALWSWPAAGQEPAAVGGAPAAKPAAPKTEPYENLGPHPRIWLGPERLRRLRGMAARQTYNWRHLITWAEAPDRAKTRPQDGPGLALAALILAQDRPEQARRLGKLAAACALKAAPQAKVERAGNRELRFSGPSRSGAELWEEGYGLLALPKPAGEHWRIERYEENRLLVKAGQAALSQSAARGDAALFLLDDLSEANQRVGWVALTLDWGWDFFTPEQRGLLAAWLVAQAQVFADEGRGCFTPQAMAALRLTALAGIAAQGGHPGAQALIAQCLEQHFDAEILPCLKNAGQGGAWFGGEAEGALAGLDMLEFAAAVQSSLGLDLSQSASWFGERLAHLCASLLPGVNLTPRGPYHPVASLGDQIIPEEETADLVRLQMLILLALQPQNPSAGLARAQVASRRDAGLATPGRLAQELLWAAPESGEEALAFAPLVNVAPAAGLAYSRSDWSPLATWLAFSCGPHYTQSQHLAAGSLMIWRRGYLLPHAGGYDGPATPHALNYATRSAAHNTVLIHDPAEYSWLDMRRGIKPKGSYANDGGQRSWTLFGDQGQALRTAPWTASGWESGPAPWNKLRQLYGVANIAASAEMPRYFYVRGEMTKAYQGSTAKASRVVRHVFHLRAGGPQDFKAPEAVAVIDDVVLTRPGLYTRFALHFPARPQLPEGLQALGPGRLQGPLDRLSYQNPGRGRLEVRCLWPLESQAWVYGGETAGSWVAGKNYPPQAPAANPAPWRVEIGGHDEQALATPMVHVMFPADAEDPPAPEVTLLISDQPEIKGLVVHDPRWPRVVAVRLGQPDPKAELRYVAPPGQTRHLVAGLAPGVSYRVEALQDLVKLSPGPGLQAGPAGELSFLIERAAAADPEKAP
ncbi:hypothetical protein AAU61_15450 [Desulfocarbo indianensis]|nr:hypothetical protein AAU61_15450 [Desulfocarbo indianensis]